MELRSKSVLTAVGEAECLRPYYLCRHCHHGQFPVDAELDVEDTELSPGVRRMLVLVGQEAPFAQGRQQREIQQALQLELPIPLGPRIPILYVEMDGPGVPMVRKETEGHVGKQEGHLPARLGTAARTRHYRRTNL